MTAPTTPNPYLAHKPNWVVTNNQTGTIGHRVPSPPNPYMARQK